MNRNEHRHFQQLLIAAMSGAGVPLTPRERDDIEVAWFGLDEFEKSGLGLVTYENNDRYCAKELVMLPRQTCPEHRHPPIKDASGKVVDPGKRETFRCRHGEVYLFVEGERAADPLAHAPAGSEAYYTVWNQIVLRPGEQYTIQPNTLHWFQAGAHGAIVTEFSSPSRDEFDLFTDPRIDRSPALED